MASPVGFTDLLWFVGVVEGPPDQAYGRVRVRCYGIHPPVETNEVETEDLPWAVCVQGSYGASFQIPKESDWVFGFFIDGRDAQHPMILGTIPGIAMQTPAGSGGSDPYVKMSTAAMQEYGKPPMHPAVSGEEIETTQLLLQNSVGDSSVPHASEINKTALYKSRYGDSYIQVDGNENGEMILLSHDSGSHIMIDSGGNVKIKSFGDMVMSSEGSGLEKSSGSRVIDIEGAYTIRSKNASIEVSGNLNHTVKGNYNLNVGGKIGITCGHSMEVAAQRVTLEAFSEHVNLKAAEKIKIDAGSVASVKSGDRIFVTSGGRTDIDVGDAFHTTSGSGTHVTSGQRMYLTSSGNLNLKAGGIVAADGDEVHLNSGLSTAATAAEPTTEEVPSPQLPDPVEQNMENDSNEAAIGEIGGTSAAPTSGGAADLDDVE